MLWRYLPVDTVHESHKIYKSTYMGTDCSHEGARIHYEILVSSNHNDRTYELGTENLIEAEMRAS